MKMLKNNKQVGGIQTFIYGFGAASIVLAIVLLILDNVSTATRVGGLSTGASTVASNATDSMITKIGTAPTWLGILLIVGFASLILGYFALR